MNLRKPRTWAVIALALLTSPLLFVFGLAVGIAVLVAALVHEIVEEFE